MSRAHLIGQDSLLQSRDECCCKMTTVVTSQTCDQLLQRSKTLKFAWTPNARMQVQVVFQERASLCSWLVAGEVPNGDHDVGLDARRQLPGRKEDQQGSASEVTCRQHLGLNNVIAVDHCINISNAHHQSRKEVRMVSRWH